MLEGFFKSIDKGFSRFDTAMTDNEIIYFIKSRGKLTEFGISVIVNNFLGVLYTFYCLTRIFAIYERVFKVKIKSIRDKVGLGVKLIIIMDKIKFSLFISLVYDLFFYSLHELLHHDLLIKQSALVGSATSSPS